MKSDDKIIVCPDPTKHAKRNLYQRNAKQMRDLSNIKDEKEISLFCKLINVLFNFFRMTDPKLFGSEVIDEYLRPEAMVRIPQVPT